MNKTDRVLEGRRVLIVEDEALIAIAVEDEIRQLGCTDMFVAYTKGQALFEIDSYKPAFAIIDVGLTDNGEDYDVADRLAERRFPSSSLAVTSPPNCRIGMSAAPSSASQCSPRNLPRR